MTLNRYEEAVVKNAHWFRSMEDAKGYIAVPADEYYGILGDASLIGHAVSARVCGWVLSGDEALLESARRSAEWLAERQDERGGWHQEAGFALDAAQCVFEGFYTYERLTKDNRFHDVLVKAADRMVTGTVAPDGTLLVRNLTECGEYAHFAFLAWKQTGLERHRQGAQAILDAIMANFDEARGYWNTAVLQDAGPVLGALKPCLTPILRASVARMNLKGKTIAKVSEHLLPLVMKGNGPQYTLGMMDAESLLDTLDGTLDQPMLRQQTARAIEWVERNCAGPVPGSFVESAKVPAGQEVYPLRSINDSDNASLWPTAAYLLALVGMNDKSRYGERARRTADWIVSMQDESGAFWTHQNGRGERFGEKYGNINFYGTLGLWWFNAHLARSAEPARALSASGSSA